MLEVSRYIHLNPVEAGMVGKSKYYPWSSYNYYLHHSGYHLLNIGVILDYFCSNIGTCMSENCMINVKPQNLLFDLIIFYATLMVIYKHNTDLNTNAVSL